MDTPYDAGAMKFEKPESEISITTSHGPYYNRVVVLKKKRQSDNPYDCSVIRFNREPEFRLEINPNGSPYDPRTVRIVRNTGRKGGLERRL